MKTLFLQNISCIDHALIDNEGVLVGGSYHISCYVSGDVVGDEQVVVDFSKLKGSIKKLIDDIQIGYDHKCWIIPGYSNCEAIPKSIDEISVTANSFEIDAPSDAFAIFKTTHDNARALKATIEVELSKFLRDELVKIYPEINLRVIAILNQDAFIPAQLKHNTVYFNYTHGLKNSSSVGCQNIAHGHYSFISLSSTNLQRQIGDGFLTKLKNELGYSNPNIFIFRENIVEETDEFIEIEYDCPRGHFRARYLKSKYQIIILETETTIENIIDWFVEKYKKEFSVFGIKQVFISEGLQKGSYYGE